MKMPWWLLLLRLLLATALILAVARPLLNPQADLPGKGPLMLVIDDGWSSAPGWTTRIAHAERLIQRAERASRLVALTGTAPAAARCAGACARARCGPTRRAPPARLPAQALADRPRRRRHRHRPDQARSRRLCRLAERRPRRRRRRQAHRAAAKFDGAAGRAARRRRPRRCCCCRPTPRAATSRCTALRPVADGPRKTAVQAADDQGRVVARIELDFAATATKGEGVAAGAAGAAQPHGAARHRGAGRRGQHGAARRAHRAAGRSRSWASRPPPTASRCCRRSTSSRRALDPYVSLSIGDRETVLTRNTAVLLIPDGAAPSAADRDEIAKWIERGGVAVRFAGPNLAAGGDTAGADAAAPGRPRAGRRHELGPADARSPSSRPTARSSASRSPRTCASPSRCWPSRRPTSPTRPGRG